ncbi:hypothetical protein SRABI133_03481 [Peribacillus simplex]|uniref:Uncharacterized protein n=1 Tax=Peribacillus simplex TaxID=1478 RepID=A0A9W4L156_9BACI|nr:hypothetical protein SRABI133_03481 [Peribacillus simplex]
MHYFKFIHYTSAPVHQKHNLCYGRSNQDLRIINIHSSVPNSSISPPNLVSKLEQMPMQWLSLAILILIPSYQFVKIWVKRDRHGIWTIKKSHCKQ